MVRLFERFSQNLPEWYCLSVPYRKWRYMSDTFGSNTITILFIVYWSQGFKSISNLAITLYYKDIYGLDPSSTQYIRVAITVAWLVKPIYGLITDNWSIFGYQRKSYLFIAGLIGIFSMLSMSLHNNLFLSVFALVLSEFSQAFSDVIADAIMVEKSRNDENGSSALQSYSWASMAFGGIVGAVSGGMLLEVFSAKTIIVLSGLSPLLLVFSAVQYEEEESSKRISQENSFKLLWQAVKQPRVFKSLIFIMILKGTTPRLSELMAYYMKDVLGLSSSFISSLGLVSNLTLIIGSGVYHRFLKDIEYRKIICIAQLLLFSISWIDLGLVTGVYEVIGVPSWSFIIGEQVLGYSIHYALIMMPVLVMSANICPHGIEATFYALFTSVANLSSAFSGILGGYLTWAFGVKSGNYELMWVLMVIAALSHLVPLMFLSLMPKLHSIIEESDEIELSENE